MPLPLLPIGLGLAAGVGGSAIANKMSKRKVAGKQGLAGLQQAGLTHGAPAQVAAESTLSPEQQQLQNSIIQRIMSSLGSYNLPGQQMSSDQWQNLTQGFQPIEDQYMGQFYNQTVPTIAERFQALGDSSGNSALTQQLGMAGSDLQGQLAALRSQYGMQNQSMQNNNLANLLSSGLSQNRENFFQPAQMSGIGNFLTGIAPGVGMGGTMLAGRYLGF